MLVNVRQSHSDAKRWVCEWVRKRDRQADKHCQRQTDEAQWEKERENVLNPWGRGGGEEGGRFSLANKGRNKIHLQHPYTKRRGRNKSRRKWSASLHGSSWINWGQRGQQKARRNSNNKLPPNSSLRTENADQVHFCCHPSIVGDTPLLQFQFKKKTHFAHVEKNTPACRDKTEMYTLFPQCFEILNKVELLLIPSGCVDVAYSDPCVLYVLYHLCQFWTQRSVSN